MFFRSAVYSGIWGFSPFLTAGALAKTFFAPSSARVVIVAVMACLFTVGAQVAWTQVKGDTSGGLKPPADLALRCFGSWWAATAATYCPGRMTAHLKSKTGGLNDGSPCR